MTLGVGREAAVVLATLLVGCASPDRATPARGLEHGTSAAAAEGASIGSIAIDTGDLMKLDPTQATREPGSDLLWYDARNLGLEGKGWTDTEGTYERLPGCAKNEVPPLVWELSKHTAGLCVRFVTDARQIGAIWDGGGAMNHMAASGNSGLDLYRRHDGQWEFCGVGRPEPTRTTAVLARNLEGAATEYLLYLPLYQKVTELKIGVDAGALLAQPPPRPDRDARPIVFYGTSITQGGCASRAGMCHAAILGRWLDRAVINLGFSGAGKMEPALGDLLSELDAAVFVLDCLPNMTPDMVRERVVPFVLRLRAARPATPILLVEDPHGYADNADNRALQDAFGELNTRGVKNLHYLTGAHLLDGPENGTVDGVHPTDLGFYRMAVAFRPALERLLTP
jgi:hypothetical protein